MKCMNSHSADLQVTERIRQSAELEAGTANEPLLVVSEHLRNMNN